MGNIRSCSCMSNDVSVGNTLRKKGKLGSTKTAILLDSRGNTREMKLPAKSGELMIEEFGHVITPVDEIRRTGRVSALHADEELVAGKVYLLLPVNRLHSKASVTEMAIAEKHVTVQKGNLLCSKAKVSPSTQMLPVTEVAVFPINKPRWNPVLDPIFESPSPLHQSAQL